MTLSAFSPSFLATVSLCLSILTFLNQASYRHGVLSDLPLSLSDNSRLLICHNSRCSAVIDKIIWCSTSCQRWWAHAVLISLNLSLITLLFILWATHSLKLCFLGPHYQSLLSSYPLSSHFSAFPTKSSTSSFADNTSNSPTSCL